MTAERIELTIVNKRGLHARAAAKFVGLARGYTAELSVSRDGETADGRSIMDLLMLGAGPGTRLSVSAHGDDAPALLQAIRTLVENGFDETE
ncbi:MAG: HPr family phosphocarrier protein [Caulobacterales bacterium]|uniref:HPr family phosphocarrier protein n=1 Tax=Glycocaulis sp. TaxID=1969725 RepID=UPI003F9FFD9F